MLELILKTFVTVFLAELGDKTQFSTMLLASQSKNSILPVFVGAVIALTLSSLLGVILGAQIFKFIPANYIKIMSGIIFIFLGLFTLFGKG